MNIHPKVITNNLLQNNKDSKYAEAIQTMNHVTQQRQLIPWLMPDLLFSLSSLKSGYDASLEILHNFTQQVIKDKRQENAAEHLLDKTKSTGPVAFLDLVS